MALEKSNGGASNFYMKSKNKKNTLKDELPELLDVDLWS